MHFPPGRVWRPIVPLVLLLAVNLEAARPGTFERVANLAAPRSAASAVVLADGRILITGGTGADGSLATADLYENGSIVEAARMNIARSDHASVRLADGRVLVTGGITSDGQPTWSAEVFDPAGNKWTQVGDMAIARTGHTAVALRDGRVVVAGGRTVGSVADTIEIFSAKSNKFTPVKVLLSSPRVNHASAALPDGRVLIAGGEDSRGALSSIDIFDPRSRQISEGPDLSVARTGLSATVLADGNVLLLGGSNGKQDLATGEVFEASTGTLSRSKGSLSKGRREHIALLLPANNSVLVAGGTGGRSSLQSSELYRPWIGSTRFADRLKFWQSAFESTAPLAEARTNAVAFPAKEGEVIVLGGDQSGAVERYSYPTLRTNAQRYGKGQPGTISGSGWEPGETVTLRIDAATPGAGDQTVKAVADDQGTFQAAFATDAEAKTGKVYITGTGTSGQGQILMATIAQTAVACTTDSDCVDDPNPCMTSQCGAADPVSGLRFCESVPDPAGVCPQDPNVCTLEQCSPPLLGQSVCETVDAPDFPDTGCEGAPGSDNNPCTQDGCQDGLCVANVGGPKGCFGPNPCDRCDPADGDCKPIISCLTSANCPPGESCNAGVCSGSQRACNADDNACTADTCSPDCQPGPPPVCEDNNACTANSCDANGNCAFTPISCEDNNACTTDGCDPQTGCTHGQVSCDDNNPCTVDTCDPVTGCAHTPKNCGDGNACTTDSCNPNSGICEYAPVVCNDNNACTTNTCDPNSGCAFPPVNCDDQNACTTDGCNPSTGCTHAAVNCNDNNACTVDSCNPNTGCQHTGGGGAEVCNGVDDDCDGKIDEGFDRGKMTGGGQVFVNGQKRSFGFNAKGTPGGKDKGEFNYVNHSTGVKIHGEVIRIIYACNCEMKFVVKDKKTGCKYEVTVKDVKEPNQGADMFELKPLSPAPCKQESTFGPRPVQHGNIQCHKHKDRDEDDDDDGDCENEDHDDD